MHEVLLEGLVELVITVVGGGIVGLYTTKYLKKREELIRVEGVLLEKRVPVYCQIAALLEDMKTKQLVVMLKDNPLCSALLKLGFDITPPEKYTMPAFFSSPESMREKCDKVNDLIIENKIYFDDEVAKQARFYQHYIDSFMFFIQRFRDTIQQHGLTGEELVARKWEKEMVNAFGVKFSDDFSNETTKFLEVLNRGVKQLTFKHRSDPDYSMRTFSVEDGEISEYLKKTKLSEEAGKSVTMIALFSSQCAAEACLQR